MSIKRSMKKQVAISKYNGIILSSKKKQLLKCTTWMNLKSIMLSERVRHKRYLLFDSFKWNSRKDKTTCDKIDQWVQWLWDTLALGLGSIVLNPVPPVVLSIPLWKVTSVLSVYSENWKGKSSLLIHLTSTTGLN